MQDTTDYKSPYYQLFADLADCIETLEKDHDHDAGYAAGMLHLCLLRAEERYISE